MEEAKSQVKKQWNALPEQDKNLLRFYLQFSEEELLKRIENYSKLVDTVNNTKRQKEFTKQVELYSIAYLIKLHSIPVKGGRKTRKQRKSKKRQSRRLR